MNEFEVIADLRTELGKGASRRLRRSGALLGVLYGADKDPVPLTFDGNQLRKQMESEAFFSHILTVKVNGEESQAVVKAMQRDPASEQVVHLDLQRVSSALELHIRVPLHFVNEEESPGRYHGGVISHLMVDVEVGCLPKDLPQYIEVDMLELDVGDSLHLSQLVLPEGVRLMVLAHDPDNDQTVVTIQHPQKLDEPTPEEALEAEGLEGEGEEEGEAVEGEPSTTAGPPGEEPGG